MLFTGKNKKSNLKKIYFLKYSALQTLFLTFYFLFPTSFVAYLYSMTFLTRIDHYCEGWFLFYFILFYYFQDYVFCATRTTDTFRPLLLLSVVAHQSLRMQLLSPCRLDGSVESNMRAYIKMSHLIRPDARDWQIVSAALQRPHLNATIIISDKHHTPIACLASIYSGGVIQQPRAAAESILSSRTSFHTPISRHPARSAP